AAFAVGTVTGGAGAVVDTLAALNQFGQRELLVHQGFQLGRFGFFLAEPVVVFVLGNDIDHDRQDAVIATAQLRTLAAVDADFGRARGDFIDGARNRIALDRQLRHPERVDHVVAGDEETHLFIDRDHFRLVDYNQIMITPGFFTYTLHNCVTLVAT